MRVVLALLRQGRVEGGGRVRVLALQERWEQRGTSAAAAQPACPGATRQKARRQAEPAVVAPWQPAELPGDEQRDGEQDDAAEGHDDREETH